MRKVMMMVAVALGVLGVNAGGIEKNRNWKVLYGTYEGCEARAVEFLSTELGAHIQRDPGVNTLNVVACERAGAESETNRNAIVTGTRASNPLLAQLLKAEEVPEGGYIVRVVERDGRQLVLCCGSTPAAAIWAAADFIDDGLATMRVKGSDGARYDSLIFTKPRLGAYESRRAPKTKTRSIFSWANKMGDYRSYFRNMARCKFNEVILWNECPPINAREVADYARSWGVRVLWGWSWGWAVDCTKADLNNLQALEDRIVSEWQNKWKQCGGDGIYFQSFTEILEDKIGGKSVPEAVVQVVNGAARRIWETDPGLRIVFGLHAEAMKQHLDVFAQTDPRMEILWENCGGFPFTVTVEAPEDETLATCRSMLDMKGRTTGFVYKWQLMTDWRRFAHQAGPYVLGMNAPSVIDHDRRIAGELWRNMTREWLLRGGRASRLAKMIQSHPASGSLNVVVNFNEPVHLPTAIVAELFWDADDDWETVLGRVMNRAWVRGL